MDPVSKLIGRLQDSDRRLGQGVLRLSYRQFQVVLRRLVRRAELPARRHRRPACLLLPPVLLAAAIAGLAWYLQRSRGLAIGVFLGLLFIINQGALEGDRPDAGARRRGRGASMAIGVPLGIWAAHKPRVWRITQPILDLMQTHADLRLPHPGADPVRSGRAPGLIVTIIFAMPAPVRMTYLGITSIPKPMIEAGESFRRHQAAAAVEGRTAGGAAVDHGGPDAVHHAVAVDGGVRRR